MNRQQAYLLCCIAAAGATALYIALPFLEYVLAAVVLAYVLYPLHRRLASRVGERPSAIVLVVGSVVVVIAPLLYLGTVLLAEVQSLARGETELDVAAVEAELESTTGVAVDIESTLVTAGNEFSGLLTDTVTQVFATVIHASLGIALLVFLAYYCLIDGPRFVAWTRTTSPLPGDVTRELYDQIEQTTRGAVAGHLLVAFLNGVAGGIGLWVAGFPDVLFWTVVMVVLSLLPMIGAFIVLWPAVGYLAIVGQPVTATFLGLYSVLFVSSIDNYVRPLIIDQRAHVNPGLLLIGVLGGLYVFGFIGLFVGPIVYGVLAATLVTFADEYDRLGAIRTTQPGPGFGTPPPSEIDASSDSE